LDCERRSVKRASTQLGRRFWQSETDSQGYRPTGCNKLH